MAEKTLPQPRQRIRKRAITPSNPPATAFHPVYQFEECANPACRQLHVPQATGSTKCPECLQHECDIPDCWACKMEGGA